MNGTLRIPGNVENVRNLLNHPVAQSKQGLCFDWRICHCRLPSPVNFHAKDGSIRLQVLGGDSGPTRQNQPSGGDTMKPGRVSPSWR
ncbi:unnamed protein product [Linum trigynum]|uniref:Uncharacterized protein n=1 Tax=Linum trigynum TaxID=586398 RepID=A0AAV2GBV0_9ROSI